MKLDLNAAVEPRAVAVLLHPHPHFGGDRFHPFIDELFRRLPDRGVSTVRFDFSTADPETAREEVVSAIDAGAARWPGAPVMIGGYSFGAGIASGVDDQRVARWVLLAPPAALLTDATIAQDPRPKVILVPADDQFSPPDAIDAVVADWIGLTVRTIPHADHFLGTALPRIIEDALDEF